MVTRMILGRIDPDLNPETMSPEEAKERLRKEAEKKDFGYEDPWSQLAWLYAHAGTLTFLSLAPVSLCESSVQRHFIPWLDSLLRNQRLVMENGAINVTICEAVAIAGLGFSQLASDGFRQSAAWLLTGYKKTIIEAASTGKGVIAFP